MARNLGEELSRGSADVRTEEIVRHAERRSDLYSTGMGFWRLVWVVVAGILISQVINGLVGMVLSWLRSSQ